MAGPDGVFGMPGELVEREGPYLARVSLAGFLHGASAAFAAAQTTTSIGALGNTTTTITGNEALYGALSGFANTANRMAAFYERQLESLVPAVYVPSGLTGSAVIQGGVTLDGVEIEHLLAQHGRRAVARTRLIALLLAAGLAGACAGHVPAVPSVPMETALERATAASRTSLGESLRAGLQGPGTFGIEPPGAPVLVPPDVRRVWVPTHENAEGELDRGALGLPPGAGLPVVPGLAARA